MEISAKMAGLVIRSRQQRVHHHRRKLADDHWPRLLLELTQTQLRLMLGKRKVVYGIFRSLLHHMEVPAIKIHHHSNGTARTWGPQCLTLIEKVLRTVRPIILAAIIEIQDGDDREMAPSALLELVNSLMVNK
jgi:hypothetical protein